jgi:glycosyltransferase involved in cell wall biosynthesis
VPCFNEEGNLRALHQAITQTLDQIHISYELIVADDCSIDGSWLVLKQMALGDPRVRGLRLERNSGQSAAFWSGMKAARGRYIATMDADLQNRPEDLPKFLEHLERWDCVCGSRVQTRKKGDSFVRRASSRIANWVRNTATNESVTDSGCCYRVFKRECIDNLKFFKGMHRFLPTLFKIEGYTVAEISVSHRPRLSGRSHYGVWDRLFAATYDLLAVCWMQRRMFRYQIAEQINPPEMIEVNSAKELEVEGAVL